MVGRYAHLDGVLVGEEVDDLERVRDDADGKELLAVVTTLHHHANQSRISALGTRYSRLQQLRKDAPVHQSFNDRHMRLLELLLGVTASSVGEVDGMADLDVIGQGDILNLNTN